MPQEPAIIETSVIQVKSTTKDTYGNLVVSPIEGDDVKISAKRTNLFDVFQEGRAVKLYWAEYMHRKYVARAELFDGKPPEDKQIDPITADKNVEPLKSQPVMTKDDWSEKDRITRVSIQRQTALNAAVKMGEILTNAEIEVFKINKATGKLTLSSERVIATARQFEQYLDGKEVPKSRLVEEARKLGAKEIEKGD